MGLVRFMTSSAGRATRIGAGLVVIIGGLVLGGTTGIVLAVVGAVPLAAGLANVCLFAPLFHASFRGGSSAV